MEILREIKEEDMYKLEPVFDRAMDYIEDNNSELYEDLKCELEEIAYGKIITESKAHKWVKSMIPYGEHWTKEQTDSVVDSQGIEIDKLEFYITMNMMYNDYHEAIGENTDIYIKLSKLFLKDEDSVEDKLYEYKKYIVK